MQLPLLLSCTSLPLTHRSCPGLKGASSLGLRGPLRTAGSGCLPYRGGTQGGKAVARVFLEVKSGTVTPPSLLTFNLWLEIRLEEQGKPRGLRGGHLPA